MRRHVVRYPVAEDHSSRVIEVRPLRKKRILWSEIAIIQHSSILTVVFLDTFVQFSAAEVWNIQQ